MTDLTPDIIEKARRVLVDEGADSEGGWHSWRCFDRYRYPEPCDCTEEVTRAALSVVASLIAAQALENMADRLSGSGPDELSYVSAIAADLRACAAKLREADQ